MRNYRKFLGLQKDCLLDPFYNWANTFDADYN